MSTLSTNSGADVFAAPVHSGPDVRVPDRRQTVSDPGVSERRGTLHAPGARGHLPGGHGLVSTLT